MSRWMLLAMALSAGIAVLAFLRLVSNELALRIRALHLCLEAEEKERARREAEAAENSDRGAAAA